jgi:hypothetical protein
MNARTLLFASLAAAVAVAPTSAADCVAVETPGAVFESAALIRGVHPEPKFHVLDSLLERFGPEPTPWREVLGPEPQPWRPVVQAFDAASGAVWSAVDNAPRAVAACA